MKLAKKIPRNKPCPCGSGLKYKKCHLAFVNGKKQAKIRDARQLEEFNEMMRQANRHPDLTKRGVGIGASVTTSSAKIIRDGGWVEEK